MLIQINGCDSVAFPEIAIPLTDFPDLVQKHLNKNKVITTPQIEAAGVQLQANDFPLDDLESFIHMVCDWAGGRWKERIEKLILGNDKKTLRDQFIRASYQLSLPNIQEALEEINKLKGLGQPSFATKHLRFLRPDLYSILDQKIIATKLSYNYDIPDCYRYLFERSASASKWVQAGRLRAFHLWFSPNCGAFDCRFRLFCSRPEDTGNS